MTNIRKATPQDIAGIIELFLNKTGRHLNSSIMGANFPQYPAIVCERDKKIIGFAYTGRAAPDILELLNIYLTRENRSNGLGGKLLENIERLARNQEQKAVILVNSSLYGEKDDKRSAESFYARNGYKTLLNTENTVLMGKTL